MVTGLKAFDALRGARADDLSGFLLEKGLAGASGPEDITQQLRRLSYLRAAWARPGLALAGEIVFVGVTCTVAEPGSRPTSLDVLSSLCRLAGR